MSIFRSIAIPVVLAVVCVVRGASALNIVTNNLQINFAADLVDDNSWPDSRGLYPGLERSGVNRTAGQTAVPSLINYPETPHSIDSYYAFARTNVDGTANGEMVMHMGIVGGTDSTQELINDLFNDRNTTFEIWFKPNSTSVPRQILWETGGGTGSSFTLNNATLKFQTISNGQSPSATNDVSTLIVAGEWIQAVGLINFGSNTVSLYVNGEFVDEATAGGNINDWDGGDGDGIGGRGGNNLGGFGNGWNYDGGDYGDFDGAIASFRIYQDTAAAAGTGALLSDAEILQNYKAIIPDRAFFNNGAGGNAWTNDGNWVAGVVPAAYTNVFVGNGRNVIVAAVITNEPANVFLGHGITVPDEDGSATLTVASGGALTIDRNLAIGNDGLTGHVVQNGGDLTVESNLVYGQTGGEGGDIRLNGGTLHVKGNIIERDTSVNSAQVYIDGGTLVVDGDSIVVQSFRTGDAAGKTGTFTLDGGKTLENTGSYFASRLGMGTFHLVDGTLDMTASTANDVRIAAEGTTAVGLLTVGSATSSNAVINVKAGEQIEVGLKGDGTLILSNGTVNCLGDTRFGFNGGSGTVTIENGDYIIGRHIVVGAAAGRAELNLNGGRLRLDGGSVTRDVIDYTQSGGALLDFAMADATDGPTPLTVSGTATIGSPGALLSLDDPPPAVLDFNERTTWIGGTNVWDADAAKWLTDHGDNALPSEAAGHLGTGRAYPVLVSPNGISNPTNLVSASLDWEVVVPDINTVSMKRTGTSIPGEAAMAVISDSASVVTRATDLSVAQVAGADAARMEINGGSLTLSGASELILGGSSQGNVYQNGGTVVIEDDLRYGPLSGGTGGEYHLRGGTLEVRGEIVETTEGVGTAQMFVDGGTLIAPNKITTQSFRTGNSAGYAGRYAVTNGQLIFNTGTAVSGYQGDGQLDLFDGQLLSKNNFRVASQVGSTGVVNVGTATTEGYLRVFSNGDTATDAGFNLGDGGPGVVNLTNGTILTHTRVRFGRQGGGGTLNIAGGRFTCEARIQTHTATQALINVTGGELELVGNPNARTVSDYRQGGGTVRFSVTDTGVLPLTVTDTATFATGATVGLVGWRNGAVSTVGSNAVTWIGGAGTWDDDVGKWEDLHGANYLPSNANDFVPTGTVYTLFSVGTLVGGSNLQAVSSDYEVFVSNTNDLAVRVVQDGIAGGPVTAMITNPASVVTVNRDLSVIPRPGADAAQLIVSNGQFTISGGNDLVLGGAVIGTASQDGGRVDISGDLVFGLPFGGAYGGIYNLNGGTLNVQGDISETFATVDTAQIHLNGGTLNVGGRIVCQRFSVAETGNYTNSYRVVVPLTTTGDFCAGGFGDSVGEIIIDSHSPPLDISRLRCAQKDNATGTVRIQGGSVAIGTGGVEIGGDAQTDTNCTGHLVIGTSEGGAPVVTVQDSNTEVGQGGVGTFTMCGGSYTMDQDNIVLAQGPDSTGTLTLEGGMITLLGTDNNGNLNFNRGHGTVIQNGGTFNVCRAVNLGMEATASMTYQLNGGELNVGTVVDYRNNGMSDAFHLAGGALVFTNAGGTVHYGNRTGDTNLFTFTGGLMKNCATFYGDLEQQGGTLEIADGVGTMSILAGGSQGMAGDYTLSGSGVLSIDVNGLAQAGVTNGYDQFTVAGSVTLGGKLAVSGDVTLTGVDIGTSIVIIDNQGANPVSGKFAQVALPSGEGGITFAVDYAGGDGNDVALTVVEQPGMLLIVR